MGVKVEMTLPDPPEGWGYTGEHRHAKPGEMFVESNLGFHKKRVGGFESNELGYIILRKLEPPYPAPEGYEFTGEFRKPKRGEYHTCCDGPYLVGLNSHTDNYSGERWILRKKKPAYTGERWILRKKKPTYTEAVKATGWKWPEDLHPKQRYITIDRRHERTHEWEPSYRNGEWYDGQGLRDLDVTFKMPPTLGYPYTETLLCRDDFV